MGCVHGLLLVFGLVYWWVEERDCEMERQDLRVGVLLSEFVSVGEGLLRAVGEVHAGRHAGVWRPAWSVVRID